MYIHIFADVLYLVLITLNIFDQNLKSINYNLYLYSIITIIDRQFLRIDLIFFLPIQVYINNN